MFFSVPVEFSDISTMNMDYSDHQRKHGILKECRGHSSISVVGAFRIKNGNTKPKQEVVAVPQMQIIEKMDQIGDGGE